MFLSKEDRVKRDALMDAKVRRVLLAVINSEDLTNLKGDEREALGFGRPVFLWRFL